MSDVVIGDLLPANPEKGPSRPITIRRGAMISGRQRQAERSQAGGEPKSGFVDDRAGAPRFGNPQGTQTCRAMAVHRRAFGPLSRANRPNYTAAAIAPVIRQHIKSRSGRFQLAEVSAIEVPLYQWTRINCAILRNFRWGRKPERHSHSPGPVRLRFLRFRSAKR